MATRASEQGLGVAVVPVTGGCADVAGRCPTGAAQDRRGDVRPAGWSAGVGEVQGFCSDVGVEGGGVCGRDGMAEVARLGAELEMAKALVRRVQMFPSCFSRIHLPQYKTSILLRDPDGNAWKVVYNPYREKSMYRLCGGWSAFVLGNNLEEGDFCAFELIGEFELRVHIFRVVEEITPLSRLSMKRGQQILNYALGMG